MTDELPQRLAVVGGGRMGAAIAQVFAAAGTAVTVFDPSAETRDTVHDRVASACRLLGVDAAEVVSRVRTADGVAPACAGTDLVIEAGPENLAVKREIFAELDAVNPPGVTLATNTSAIEIGRIAEGLTHPERVLGTHFWNPPYLIPLVEVVRAAGTSARAIDATVIALRSAGLMPVPVDVDVPGSVGNRLQHALKREAIALVAAGVCSAETVDTVCRYGFGRRLPFLGPLEQADLGGLDLTLAIHEVLMPDLDATREPQPLLVELVGRGDLGARTGRGFRTWQPGEAERRLAEVNASVLRQGRLDGRTAAG
jgi:3-hydroxybutyryl-CoA dehydrogenase